MIVDICDDSRFLKQKSIACIQLPLWYSCCYLFRVPENRVPTYNLIKEKKKIANPGITKHTHSASTNLQSKIISTFSIE